MLLRLLPFKGPRERVEKRLIQTVLLILALVFVLVVYFDRTPSSPPKQESWHPKSHDRPRYIHYSSFRENPDYKYEKELSTALRAIEENVKSRHREARQAHVDTIWQVLLKDPDRPEDSLELEEANPGWEYRVSNLSTFSRGLSK